MSCIASRCTQSALSDGGTDNAPGSVMSFCVHFLHMGASAEGMVPPIWLSAEEAVGGLDPSCSVSEFGSVELAASCMQCEGSREPSHRFIPQECVAGGAVGYWNSLLPFSEIDAILIGVPQSVVLMEDLLQWLSQPRWLISWVSHGGGGWLVSRRAGLDVVHCRPVHVVVGGVCRCITCWCFCACYYSVRGFISSLVRKLIAHYSHV